MCCARFGVKASLTILICALPLVLATSPIMSRSRKGGAFTPIAQGKVVRSITTRRTPGGKDVYVEKEDFVPSAPLRSPQKGQRRRSDGSSTLPRKRGHIGSPSPSPRKRRTPVKVRDRYREEMSF